MPIHDWTRVQSGLFHDFHQVWSVEIRNSLNRGLMPKGFYALVQQKGSGPEPDVIAVEMKKRGKTPSADTALATLEVPQSTLSARIEPDAVHYARKANRIAIRHPLGEVVAIIEIISPGNKESRHSLRSFVEKAVAFLRNGIHLLIIDLFPPSSRDPQGIHQAIWDEMADQPFELPADKRLTLVSYAASDGIDAHIEPVAVGMPLPSMPLFLERDLHVMVPLEAIYTATWDLCPEPIREMVESPHSSTDSAINL